MRNFWRFFLLAVTGLALMVFSPPMISHASVVPASGLDVNSAVITNASGQVFSHDVELPAGEYTVSYNWSIADNVRVRAGDTMTFTLPANIHIPEDDSFTLYTVNNAAIGKAFIPKGSNTGTITLNSYMQNRPKNRRGWIKVDVPVPAEPTGPISMNKSASWVDPENPTVINWQLTVHPDGNTLTNPVIKDTFSRNQTYVAGSVRATDANGQNITVTANSSLFSNAMTFKLAGSYTSDLTITYQTKTKLATGADTFNNHAVYSDDGGHQASANAEIDREDNSTTEPENPDTEQPGQKEPITMSKSVSWDDPDDQTKLNWSIRIQHHDNNLVNPQIVDHLSGNQSYIDGSAKMVTPLGDNVKVTATVSDNGQVITFKALGTYSTDLHLTYQTSAPATKENATFTNQATYTDDNGNDAQAQAEIERTQEPEVPTKEPISMTKSVAWADPVDKTRLNWQLNVSANDNELVNPTIVDKMSANQSYVAGSAKATTATGENIPVEATTNGTEISFELSGTYKSNLQLTYQTTTNEVNTTETFTNVALYSDEAGNQASANANIDREATELPENDPITMQKTAAWSDPTDKTKINWTLAVNSNGNRLINPTITDQLSDNQTYVANSVQVSDGNSNLPVIATVNGSKVTFKISSDTTANLKVTYQTTTNDSTGADTFDNAAVYDDEDNNHAEANTSIDRENPSVTPAKDPIALTKTAAWSDPTNHDKINWELKVAVNGNTLKNPVVTDTLSDNQTYVANSLKAVDAAGNTIPVDVTVNGNTLTIKFDGQLSSDLTLTYQTTTNEASGAATFDNVATVDDENDNHASGGSSIDRENPAVEPDKDPISMTKVAAWTDPNDKTKINWTLAIKANENQLVNPVITDILSGNQTYVTDSAKATDENGVLLPLTVSVSGSTITFKLTGDFETNINLTYQTTTDRATGAEVFDNAASYTDDNNNNASASTEIDRPAEPTNPEEPGEPNEPGTTEPGQPEEPGEPNEPGTTEPGQPEEPGEPNEPGTTEPGQPEEPGEPNEPGTTEPGQPTTPGEPNEPGTTEPGQPATPGESNEPGTTEPGQPTTPGKPNEPGTTEPNTGANKPGTTPAQPGQVPSQSKSLPTPYNPTPGRLPQTDENQNAAGDTLIGSLILIFSLGLGYLGLRHRN